MHPGGDATPVVGHAEGAVAVDFDADVGAGPGQGLIYSVIHQLVGQVVQSIEARAPHIHPRPALNVFWILQHLDVAGVVSCGHSSLLREKSFYPNYSTNVLFCQ